MYELMATFDPTRATPVAGGSNGGLNFGNVVANSKDTGCGDYDGGGGTGRKLECWHCVGEQLKRNFPKRHEEKEKTKKDNSSADGKRADGET